MKINLHPPRAKAREIDIHRGSNLVEVTYEEKKARMRERYETDAAYREQCNARSRRRRQDKLLMRNDNLKTKFGIGIDEYDRLLAEQNGMCAICNTAETGRHSYFHVDHDHRTGRVRGLLCQQCNTAIGLLKESVPSLERAADYIRKHKD